MMKDRRVIERCIGFVYPMLDQDLFSNPSVMASHSQDIQERTVDTLFATRFLLSQAKT